MKTAEENVNEVMSSSNKMYDEMTNDEKAKTFGLPRFPSVGKKVIWHDAVGTPFEALVTAAWSPTCINVVFVSEDEKKQDSYGRQIERATSCQHKSIMNVHGFYWRFEDEELNEYVAPLER